jgi:hypothetical protein
MTSKDGHNSQAFKDHLQHPESDGKLTQGWIDHQFTVD